MYNVEEWREIPGFPGYEASSVGNLRTYWYKVKSKGRHGGTHRERLDTPRMLSSKPDDNGYLHTNLYCEIDGKRYTRKVHTLVAKTFLPLPDDYESVDYTVDHIVNGPKGKLDNRVDNLRWLPRSDNIKKAYKEGIHINRIQRSYRDVMVTDLWTGDILYFESISEAARELGLSHSSISHMLRGDCDRVSHYTFEYAGREDRLLYANEEYECCQRVSRL